MEEWRWDGSIWDFAEVVQWALVLRQLSKDKPAGWTNMVSEPKMIEQKADEYGITLRAVTSEMLRIGDCLKRMYEIIDKRAESEDNEA